MNRLFSSLFIASAALIIFLYQSCANIGSITGGDKDSIPPEMVASKPILADTGFKGNKLYITFNEFVELKNINQEFIASPPFKKVPDFKIKNKSVVVKFEEPLKDSVTYTLNFGNAIADYNEGNVLENFRFVFSTYSRVDSFSIAGNIKNAFDLKVPENTLVMVFEENSDSIPYKEIPSYLSKIDTSGFFSIDHIKPGKYKLFGLADMNGNMLTDEFEPRAFLDSLIVPERSTKMRIDSLKAGTILHDIKDTTLSDSLTHDTVIVSYAHKTKPSDIQLYMFSEDNLNQRIIDYSRPLRGRLNAVFQLPVDTGLNFIPLNQTIRNENLFIEKNLTRDSLIFWVNDSLALSNDSLLVELSFLKKDSLGLPTRTSDTLLFEFREKKADDWKRKPQEKKEVKKEYLQISYIAKEKLIDINKNLLLESPSPLLKIDTSKIKLFEILDTLVVDTKEQKIEKAFRFNSDVLFFKFKRPVARNFWMESLNFKAENWYTTSVSDSNRIYTCRITDRNVAKMDTLKLKVHFDNHFFLEQIQQLTDTLDMPISVQKILSRKRNEANRIDLVLDKPQNTAIEIIPDDFFPKGNWFRIEKSKNQDSVAIIITDKKISDRDTLTFSVKCFDYIGLNNDSVYFSETTRLLYREQGQFLSSANRLKSEEIVLVFNKKLKSSPQLIPQNFTVNKQWFIINQKQTSDTVSFQITDSLVSKMDTLNLIVKYQDENRKGIIRELSDTLKLANKSRVEIKAKTKNESKIVERPKEQTVNIYLPYPYELADDSLNIRRKIIKSEWKSKTKYRLTTDSLAFTDFYNRYNKSGQYEFATREIEFYAKLIFDIKQTRLLDSAQNFIQIIDTLNVSKDSISNVQDLSERSIVPFDEIKKIYGDGNLILQLLTDKDNVVKTFYLSDDKQIKIEFLHPGKYGLKVIFDRNNNKKWDTGNYFRHIQPERVIINDKPIELKSDFETTIELNIRESLIKSFTALKSSGL